ncbi:MAG: tetratricopeptide repeat protein [Bdellovibrionia bacterium]
MKASLRLKVALGLTLAGAMAPHTTWAKAPYSESEIQAVETSDESRIRELRDQEIKQLRIALGRRLPNNRRADLYYRLAELYLEAYRQEYLLEGRAHDKRLERKQADPAIDHSRSRPYLLSGVQASQEILKLKIAYPRLDQIYYFLAFNYSELGDRKQGLKYYEELTHRFPNSPFVAEAQRELADDAYTHGNYRKAISLYELAVHRANSNQIPQIDHKLAWAYYRVKQYDQAIAKLKEAVNLAQKSGEKLLSVREEALRDMAVFMTEAGRVDEAITYFQATVADKSFYPKLLEKLGKQYERNVEPAKATMVYESLLKTNPESESAFRVLVKLVDLDLRRSRFKEALARLKDLRAAKFSEDDTQVASQNLRAMIRRTATEHHEMFRKKADRPALEIAESYYTAYLTLFLSKDDPRKETQEIQMYLAEVKRELGKSKEASQLYRKVVDSRDSRYAKEAGALWTASLSEAIKRSSEGGASSKATEPSTLEREYVEAADALQASLGDTAEGREAALRAAQVLAGYAETRKDALKRIRKMIESSPKTPQALTAARLWIQLQSENPKNDQDDMKDLIAKLRENTALMSADQEIGKGKLKAAIFDQETRIKVSTISQEEKEHKYADAARGYESFAQDSQQKDTAEKALTNAVASYIKVGDTDSVERVLVGWFKRFPKSPKAVESAQSAATLFLVQGKFETSARMFEEVGSAGGDAVSFETAARIYEGLAGDPSQERAQAQFHFKRAQANHVRYIQSLKNPSARGSALLTLAKSYEEAQSDREAVQAYRDCMSASPEFEAECGVRLAELQHRLKNEDDAVALLKKVAAQGTKHKSEALSPYVGYARFQLADRQEQSMTFEPLALPDERLKKAMNQRLAFMETISRSYQSVVDAGGPWAIAALDRLARAALSFANEVDQIAPPAKLSDKGAEQFKKNLASVSAPLRKKAIDTWMDAYRKAVSAEALSPVIPEIADRLADEGVRIPGRAQGFRGGWRLAGAASDGGAEGESKALDKVRDRLTRNPADSSAWVDYGNLLWGSGKLQLSRLAYERALQLNPKNAAALNNRAVVLLSTKDGQEDWVNASESLAILQKALKEDEFFAAAKVNRGLLLNYYRLFERAKPLFEQVLVRNQLSDAEQGLAVALQGLGDSAGASAAFQKAAAQGASSSSFASLYHRAAQVGPSRSSECLDALSDLKSSALSGFERDAYERLKQVCTTNQGAKK